MRKIVPISLKVNFTPNTLDCYGLRFSFWSGETFSLKIVDWFIFKHNKITLLHRFPNLRTTMIVQYKSDEWRCKEITSCHIVPLRYGQIQSK